MLFMGLVAFFGLVGLVIGPRPLLFLWVIFWMGVIAILYQPRYGIYLATFWALVSDSILNPYNPFLVNFSGGQSLLYIHDAIIISPLEAYLAITFISWLGRGAMQRKLNFFTGQLFWPVIVFAAFVLFGLVNGIGTGGDINIALWEARPLLYLVAMLILVSNLIQTRSQVNKLMWIVFIALFIEGILGTWFFVFVTKGDLSLYERITEHSAAIHMNSFFVFLLAVWIYKGSSWSKRIILPIFALPIFVTYVATQRRSAFLTLGIALVLLGFILFKERRMAFWFVAPPFAILGIIYVAVFWNNEGTLGIPAQAVKSVVAEDQANAKDLSSNLYREIENYNVSFTIRAHPLTGRGFGQKFYVVVPLPDISDFTWWQYFPHNSIMWIWIKMGFFGFLSMLFLVGSSIMIGARVMLRMPKGDLSAVALTATLYFIMHFTFAYADISWGAQSMLYIGIMMGFVNSLEKIVAQPVLLPEKRWPWQSDPEPAPALLPMPVD